MAKDEVIRFNKDLVKFQKLVLGLNEAGSNVSKVVSLANEFGYDFTEADVSTLQKKIKESQTGEAQTRALVGAVVGGAFVV